MRSRATHGTRGMGTARMPGPEPTGGLRARQPEAVRHAAAVLEEVARSGPGVTGTRVARNVGLPKATTYRLLTLLVELEYLERTPDRHGFALGPKVPWLAGRLLVQ